MHDYKKKKRQKDFRNSEKHSNKSKFITLFFAISLSIVFEN